MDDLEVFFLCDSCQRAESVAHRLADFLSRAQKSIDISIYSFKLSPALSDIVAGALRERQKAGVTIRIAYDAALNPEAPIPSEDDFSKWSTPDYVRSLGFTSKPILGERALMHNKYVIVDDGTSNAAVWTGSANFNDDGWSLQDNNILILRTQRMAGIYTYDFNDLWKDGLVQSDAVNDSGEETLEYKGRPAHVVVNFSPCEGEWIDQSIANQIERTQQRVTLAFPVLTSGNLLEALTGLMKRGIPFDGVYDQTQMEGVKYQWEQVPDNHWKIGTFAEIVEYGHLVPKKTIQWTATSTHDFMHNKVMVLDDTVVTGSYNFSRHAQSNAENSLMITSEPLAETYRDYIDTLKTKYADWTGREVDPRQDGGRKGSKVEP
ncbi:MAG TPA: phosphatidylserine/phosphatidylglycerophosphate/cardiolipin synthase family protein [Chloroflexia bacterium]|nr:phosphatidylserine/phosphatidylglycerophosphate/cardiolipin synthase family protein [Chloroflexia bacterium]